MSKPLPGLSLLVLDMQAAFLSVIPDAAALTARTRFAIEAARLFGIPVVFTEQVPDKLGSTLPELLAAAEEPDGTPAPVFGKALFSAWADDAVRAHLTPEADGLEPHILVAGIETPVCVYQTTTGILAGDGEVTLLTDALGCRRREDGEAALRAMAVAGAHCLPAETVFYSILGGADHPAFRAYTALVKATASGPA